MSIKLKGSTDGSVTLQAPADTSPTGTDKTFTLPTQDGTDGQVLATDGNGNLSFADDSDTILESNRNLIINGAQQVDQRGSGSSAIGTLTNGKYITDRWNVRGQDNTTGQCSQSTNAPAGFVNSLLIEVGGTATTTGAGGNRFIRHNIEGYVLRPLRWGTAGAKAATMSFWVKSNVTGTYSFCFFSGALNQHYATTYSINSTNTWEYKTISVPGPTSGSFYTENQLALYCQWDLGSGSNFQTSNLNQWASGDKRFASGRVDLFNNANAHLRITGVQFEAGSTATQFEHRSYADELIRCQRYFQHSFQGAPGTGNTSNDGIVSVGGGTTGSTTSFLGTGRIEFSPNMRADPTITIFDLANPRNTGKCMRHTYGLAGTNNSSVGAHDINTKSFVVRSDGGANASGFIFHYQAEAEL